MYGKFVASSQSSQIKLRVQQCKREDKINISMEFFKITNCLNEEMLPKRCVALSRNRKLIMLHKFFVVYTRVVERTFKLTFRIFDLQYLNNCFARKVLTKCIEMQLQERRMKIRKISLLSSKMMAATMCIWYFPSSHV